MNVRCSLRSGDAESDWRGGPFEAALTAGAVAQHLRAIVDEQACRFALMSCENAHTGGWGGHTLTARFASSEGAKSEQQAPRHFELVAKPVLNAVAMMSRLGPTRIKTSGTDADDADIGAIATRLDKAQIAILLYNCSVSPAASGPDEVQLQLTNLPMPEAMVARYAVDPEHCNPQDLWRRMNCPSAPTAEQLAQLRDEAQIAMPDAPQQVQTEGGSLSLEVPLPPASVSLVLITAQPDNPPEQITGLRGVRYRGLEDTGQVMLSWTALGSPAIRTHKILRASCAEGPYEPICHGELFCSAFLDADAGKDERWYKVQAVDFWGRTGQAANITVP